MARPHVPQFGKWEGNADVPYTVVFDKARQGRGGGKMINPNDPQENPEAFGDQAPNSKPRIEQVEPVKRGPAHERKTSREDHDLRHGNVGGNKRSTSSPLHPHYQAKITGRGSSNSPSREGRGSTGHGTPGRSRLRAHDEDLDKGAAVPKFGEWDEDNPASADGFTHIFNQVREERHTGTPNITTETHDYGRSSHNTEKAKCCCFPWGR